MSLKLGREEEGSRGERCPYVTNIQNVQHRVRGGVTVPIESLSQKSHSEFQSQLSANLQELVLFVLTIVFKSSGENPLILRSWLLTWFNVQEVMHSVLNILELITKSQNYVTVLCLKLVEN